MSAKIAQTASAIVLTDKFVKELEKFFEWAIESEYLIKDINSDQHEWSIKLLTKFEEPGRNKLEAYIKALFAKYTISLNEMDIEDAKLLTKEFKDKGGKTSKTKAVDAEEKPKKSEKAKTTKKSKVEVKKVVEEVVEKVEEVESENEVENVKLDMSLDTSETFNVDTLEFWTSELVEVFGKPKKTGGKDDEHTWEWKIEVNSAPFTIYDWNENGDNFEDTTWYLGATSENKKNIKTLISYIESWFEGEVESEAEKPKKKVTTTEVEKPKKETKKVEKPKKETKKVEKPKKVKEVIEVKEIEVIEVEEKVDMDELFGDDSDIDINEDIELDLDDIEDDE
jgi:outer membrane biosynthesis protein TonB